MNTIMLSDITNRILSKYLSEVFLKELLIIVFCFEIDDFMFTGNIVDERRISGEHSVDRDSASSTSMLNYIIPLFSK